MNYRTWHPVYERILADFGYDRSADERARDRLADLVTRFDESRLDRIEGATVAVAGAGPSLVDETSIAADADVVIAASTAADHLREAGVAVDLMVTDLDKTPATARQLTREGVPVAVHAHGDNIPAIERWVPRFEGEHVLPTTQAEPRGPVRNYGGFTDGDRGAFLADAFDAASLRFPGWDFDDESVGAVKRQKLLWAERLLHWLERRRGEAFAVLDGRRDAIEPI
ncbi:6-hydroxymethylpterin diphosphokinase MptE-like protein [Haloplanus aerogenes]|uniref:6-hydroxymethyl-7,8-dihydropterin pyrophosphokinase n=1 Tax=Haloplanus aerogenes TaxID=660522 RepID=A0A3M0DSL4_9EURY|nr:6-hydroxymethylpterin diphosphokinase MptE-like protein [Haloplanus aerogenes]AZH25398.1 DUF115 domain-containing protein [Haloplanus aerogenes]RMB25104.1 hypothetical protein ATH50_0187 [Haloplanus aerogenes]